MNNHSAVSEACRRAVQEMYAASKRGDVAGFLAFIDPEVVVREPSFLPYGGVYHGTAGLQTLIGKVGALLDIPQLKVDRVVADGEEVFGVLRLPVKGDGREVTLSELSVFRKGKVVEMHVFFYEAASLLEATRTK